MPCALALASLTVGCGAAEDAGGTDPDLLLGLQAVEPKAGHMTDQTVHLTCKVIGARSGEDSAVEYVYGIADANGVAQAPFSTVIRAGGFVDLVDLQPDTTYAVTFIARLGDKRGAFAPSLTFHTEKPLDSASRFARRVIPGSYMRVTEGEKNQEVVGMTFVSTNDPSCASGVALAGNMSVLGWACMDFKTMTATRQIGEDLATYTFDFCDCSTLAADYGDGVLADCAATGATQVCQDHQSQTHAGAQFVVKGTERIGGQTTTSTFLKSVRKG